MGEMRKVRKGDGSTTVMRGGKIVGNLPGSRSNVPPTEPYAPGAEAVERGDETVSVESLHAAFRMQTHEEMLTSAKADFDSWVTAATFAELGDSSRGRFWEGAAQFASTPEGDEVLQRIASNPATTSTLRSAALALQEEVRRNKEAIQSTWTPDVVDESDYTTPQAPLGRAYIDLTAIVHYKNMDRLSPETRVLNHSRVDADSVTFGAVIIDASQLESAHIQQSEIAGSTILHAMVRTSMVEQSTISDEKRLPHERMRLRTTVIDSRLTDGAIVEGAHVEGSRIEGTVRGTGTSDAGLVDRENAPEYYVYDNYGGTDRADPDIGSRAEEATYSKVSFSHIGKGSLVENAVVSDSTIEGSGTARFARISNATISGTARVEGTYEHRLEILPGYTVLKSISVFNRRADVANVTLDREYIGPSAEISSPRHVRSVVKGGMLYTRYRTRRKGSGPFRRSWGYTKVSVDPSTGSLNYDFLGFSGNSANDAVRTVEGLFD
jgi:hypothetical protein